MKVLVLNSGSSSQKSCLYEIGDTLPDDPPACVWEGKIEWIDDQAAILDQELARRFPKGRSLRWPLAGKPSSACFRACGAARRRRFPALPKSMLWGIAWFTAARIISSLRSLRLRSSRRSKGFRLCAAPQSRRTRRHGDRCEVAGTGAAGCRLRHRISSHDASAGGHLSRALMNGSSREFDATDFTGSIINIAPSGPRSCWAEPELAEAGDLPPGQWLFAGGDSRRSKRGYDHGFYSAGGPDDGHALGLRRPRHPDLSDAAEDIFRASNSTRCSIKSRDCWGYRESRAICGEILAACKNGDEPAKWHAPNWRWICMFIACDRESEP